LPASLPQGAEAGPRPLGFRSVHFPEFGRPQGAPLRRHVLMDVIPAKAGIQKGFPPSRGRPVFQSYGRFVVQALHNNESGVRSELFQWEHHHGSGEVRLTSLAVK
jgi:hypothetical protein